MSSRTLSSILSRLVWRSLLPPIILLCVFSAFRFYESQTDTRGDMQQLLGSAGVQIDTFLETRIRPLEILANSPLADSSRRWPDLYSEAKAFHTSFASHVTFANADRVMLFSTRFPYGAAPSLVPEELSGQSFTVALESGKPALGDMVGYPKVKEPLIPIAVPGMREGQVRHLILTTVSTRELQKCIDAIPLKPDWTLTLRDGAGNLVAQNAPAGFDSVRDVEANWRFDTKPRLVPWTLSLERPRQVTHQLLLKSLGELLAAIFVAAIGGRIFGNRIAERIELQTTDLADGGPEAAIPDISELARIRSRLDALVSGLQERDRKLNTIIGNIPSAVSLKTPEGKYVLANPSLQRILKLSEAEIVGKTDFALYPEMTARNFRINDQRVLNTGAVFTIEEIVPVDGVPRYFISHMFPIHDEEGKIALICRISLDISDRKEAEQALVERQAATLAEQSRIQRATLNLMEDARAAQRLAETTASELRKFSLAIDQSPENIIITDLEANIEYVNQAFIDNTGYRREEVIGKNPRILSANKTPPEIYAAMWASLSSGKTWKGEFCNAYKDGSERYYFAIITPLRRPDGEVTHYVSVQEDITEKKRLSAELDAHRHHLQELVDQRAVELTRQGRSFQALLDNLPHMAWMKDAEG